MSANGSSRFRSWLAEPRTAGALRFAVAMLLIDIAVIVWIPGAPPTYFVSFAVVAVLWFMDFQGSASERLWAYLIGVVAGTIGVAVGSLVGGTTALAVIVAFVVVTAFAFIRILPGSFAQSVIGPQLGLLLALLTPDEPAHLVGHVAGWLVGSIFAVVVAMVVFPRQASDDLRVKLADWCKAMGNQTDTLPRSPTSAQAAELEYAVTAVATADEGPGLRATSVSRSVRAVTAMQLRAVTATACFKEVLQDESVAAASDAAGQDLNRTSAQALQESAAWLTGGPAAVVDVASARAADAALVANECGDLLRRGEPEAAVAQARAHHRFRIASLLAMQQQEFALASSGAQASGSPVEPRVGIAQTLRTNFTWRSPALTDSMRIGAAVALAVLVAKLLGVEHGFWAASVALCVSCGRLTRSGTRNAATYMVVGAALGVGIASIVVGFLPSAAMFVLLTAAAFLSKYEAGRNAFIVQLTYTPFAVFNLALLGWPDVSVARDFRLENVLIGAAVAVVATLIATPRSQTRALDALWERARASADALIADPLAQATTERGTLTAAFERDSLRFTQTLGFMKSALDESQDQTQTARAAWLQQVELSVVATRVADSEDRLPSNPGLVAALMAPADRSAAVANAASEVAPTDAGQLVAAVWSSWLLDYLQSAQPR